MGGVQIDPARTIDDVVRNHEETRIVFSRFGLSLADYGPMSIYTACAERGIDLSRLTRELVNAIEESAPFARGAFEWDLARNIVRVSPALSELIGVAEQTGPPAVFLAHVHPDDRSRVERSFRDARRIPQAMSLEYRVMRFDGVVRIFASRIEPLAGDSPMFIGMIWDITDQHTGNVSDANALLRGTLESTADGILVIDRSGNVATCNRRFFAMWQIPDAIALKGTAESLLHHVLDQLIEPEQFLANVHALYESPERESFDVLRFRDGRVFERYTRPQRVEFAIVGRVWSFRDVTERERLLAQTSFMADAQRLLSSLEIRSALDSIAVSALHFLADACAIDVFAYPDPHPTASHTVADTPFTPDLPPQVRAGRSLLYEVDHRSRVAVPLLSRGDLIGALVVAAPAQRVYTRAQLEFLERLAARMVLAIENARLLREAREALQVREEFLSIAAHELRGPVSAIHLAIQTLQRSDVGEPIKSRMLEIAAREDRRLARFADDLANITQIRSGALSFIDEDVDLAALTREAVSHLALEIDRSSSTVSVDAPSPVIGRWDHIRIDQVVTNLLRNALKFGLGRPIEVAVASGGACATLTVRDHGLGVPPAKREEIFKPFERAVSVRHYGGLGLGLFIVRTIVEQYGGTAFVDARDGGGSTFTVRLPMRRAA